MKAARINKATEDFAGVEVVEVEKPTAGSDQIVVRQKATSVNPIDWKVIAGYLIGAGWSLPLPFTLGYDFAGVVEEVGSSVSDFKVGDEVFGVNWGVGKHDAHGQPLAGCFAEYVAVKASIASKKPAKLSFAEAAAISLVGSTSFQALFECGKAKEGSKVLILGGSTATGSVAVQLAKARGVHVTTTCSTRNAEFVASLGADRVVDYTKEDWAADAALAGAVDIVYDTVGVEGTFEKAKKVLKTTGAFVSIAGFEAGFDPAAHAPLSFAAFYCLHNDRAQQDELAQLILDGKLKVKLDETYKFSEESVRAALKKQKDGKSTGKNVLLFD